MPGLAAQTMGALEAPPAAPLAGHLMLSGFMGAGKSTVARLLGERLGAPVVDLDVEIERSAGATVAQLFAREGEAGFRRREAAMLARVLAGPAAVIALGGGAMLDPTSRDRARRAGTLVTLQVEAATAARRLAGAADRPLLDAEPVALAARLAARVAAYADADVILSTDDRTPEAVADAVVAALAGRAAL